MRAKPAATSTGAEHGPIESVGVSPEIAPGLRINIELTGESELGRAVLGIANKFKDAMGWAEKVNERLQRGTR